MCPLGTWHHMVGTETWGKMLCGLWVGRKDESPQLSACGRGLSCGQPLGSVLPCSGTANSLYSSACFP